MDEKPRRRWFRFSLRTLFVLVTLLGCAMGWVVYSLNWIHQRHDAEWLYGGVGFSGKRPAPWSLRILGEDGVERVHFKVYASDYATFKKRTQERTRHLQRLFPEAEVGWYGLSPPGGFTDARP